MNTYSTLGCGYCEEPHSKLLAENINGREVVTCPKLNLKINVHGVNLNDRYIYLLVNGLGIWKKDFPEQEPQ